MPNPNLERYGGARGVAKICFQFYDLVVASERLRPFFQGVDMQRLIEHQTAVIVSLLGGTGPISRRDIVAAHAHLDIGPADFDEMIALLRRALTDAGIAPGHTDGIMRYYADYRADLVRGTDSAA